MQTYHDSGLAAGWRQIAAATLDSSNVTPFYDTAQYPKRGGRQIAAYTSKML